MKWIRVARQTALLHAFGNVPVILTRDRKIGGQVHFVHLKKTLSRFILFYSIYKRKTIKIGQLTNNLRLLKDHKTNSNSLVVPRYFALWARGWPMLIWNAIEQFQHQLFLLTWEHFILLGAGLSSSNLFGKQPTLYVQSHKMTDLATEMNHQQQTDFQTNEGSPRILINSWYQLNVQTSWQNRRVTYRDGNKLIWSVGQSIFHRDFYGEYATALG